MSGPRKSKNKPTGDYSVGYCKPPASAKWKPGKSANPSGRPKKAPSPYELFEQQAYKVTKAKINGKLVEMPMMGLAMIALLQKAATGDAKALDIMLRFSETTYTQQSKAAATAIAEHAFDESPAFSWEKEQEELFQELAAAVDEDKNGGGGSH